MRGHRAKGQRRAVFQLKAEIIPPRDQAEQQKRRSGGEGARSAGTHDRYWPMLLKKYLVVIGES